MPLPTTNLTFHLDASDTDKLFTTFVNGGPHTGTPVDGNEVQAWAAETDGSVSPANAGRPDGQAPNYRSTTPLMLLPCLDFDGADQMTVCTDTSYDTLIGTNQFFGTQTKTILLAIYPETISGTASPVTDNDALIALYDDGLHVWNDGGTRKATFSINDGSLKSVSVTIGTGATYVLCARQDSSNIYLSVDGGSEVSAACGASAVWPQGVVLGRSNNSGARYNGRYGEIAFYNASAYPTDAIAFLRSKWQGVGGSGTEALAGSAITPGHGTQTPGISISI
jgi:hypothetical protein